MAEPNPGSSPPSPDVGRHLAVLRAVAAAVSRSLDLEEVLAKSVAALTEVTGHEIASLHLLSPDGRALILRGERGLSARLREINKTLPAGEGLIGLVATRGQAVVLDEVLASPDLLPAARPVVAADRLRGFVCVPIRARDRILGTLSLGRQTPDPFSPGEIALLESAADQIGLALDNARLFQESERRRAAAERLAEVGRLLSQSLDSAEVAQLIADNVLTLLGAEVATVCQLDPASGDMVVIALAGEVDHIHRDMVLPAGAGVIGLAVRERVVVVTPDLLADPSVTLTPELQAAIERAAYRAALAVPLVVKDQIVGALGIGAKTGRVFTNEEIRLAQAFADPAAIALENSRLVGTLRTALDRLKASQQRVIETERLRAIGDLASGVAHHLNNILGVILLRTQLLVPKVQDPEIRRALEMVEEETREGAEVVQRLQAFSQVQVLVPLDLGLVIREVLEITRPRWEENARAGGSHIQALLELAEIPAIAGEPAGLRQALINLLLNAVDAMPDGGTITVKTWASPEGVYCTVADTGVGMSEEVRRRALEPFFTTKGPQARGLGLSVAYGILQRHGGELTIHSAVRKGTVVTIHLPPLSKRR